MIGERLAAALEAEIHIDAGHGFGHATPRSVAENILAADPTLAADLELGAAWREAEAALPEGVVLVELVRVFGGRGWQAAAWEVDGDTPHTTREGNTPAEALRALAEALRK